jgi:Domain of unknown function (DUF3854)
MSALHATSRPCRATPRNPCPVCGGHRYPCEVFGDGVVHCMTKESPSPCTGRLGGWLHNLSGRQQDESLSAATEAIVHASTPTPERADPQTCHDVYTALLAACRPSAKDREYLATEGIPESELAHYGTLPPAKQQGALIAGLVKQFSESTLRTVPGIVKKDGRLQLAGAGLLVAVCGVDGRIQGCQVRKHGGGYYWFSSKNNGGASSDSPCNVVRPAGAHPSIVWITEGPRKAHVVAMHTGCITIGLTGHSNHKPGIDALRQLAEQGAVCVVIALDEDEEPKTKALVETSRRALAAAAFDPLCLAVRNARWEKEQGKGADDVFNNGHTPRIEKITAVLLPDHQEEDGDPGPAGRGVRHTQAQKAARYDQLDNLFWSRDMTDPDNPKRAMTSGQKLGLWSAWRFGGFPGETPSPSPRRVPLKTMADCIGMSRQTLSENIKSLCMSR